MCKEVLADVFGAFHDGVEYGLVDTVTLAWLEESLWAHESLTADCDQLPVRQLVTLLQTGASCSSLVHLLLIVQGHVAQLLLHLTDFLSSGGVKLVPTFVQHLHEQPCEVAACKLQPEGGMGQQSALVNRCHVGQAVPTCKHHSSCASRCLQRQDGLFGQVERGSLEGLEHDPGDGLSVGSGIERCFYKHNRTLLVVHCHLLEDVGPQLTARNNYVITSTYGLIYAAAAIDAYLLNVTVYFDVSILDSVPQTESCSVCKEFVIDIAIAKNIAI